MYKTNLKPYEEEVTLYCTILHTVILIRRHHGKHYHNGWHCRQDTYLEEEGEEESITMDSNLTDLFSVRRQGIDIHMHARTLISMHAQTHRHTHVNACPCHLSALQCHLRGLNLVGPVFYNVTTLYLLPHALHSLI